MSVVCRTSEVTKTFTLHFDEPVLAVHPNFRDQHLAFTEAQVTLSAEWDNRSRTWKPKRDAAGRSPRIELIAPRAKRVDRYGDIQPRDAFHMNGKLTVTPIPLTDIVKQRWDDDTQDTIRREVLDVFWKQLLS